MLCLIFIILFIINCFFKVARKDKSVVPSVQETVKKIIQGQVGDNMLKSGISR